MNHKNLINNNHIDNLTVISYNMHGYNQGVIALTDIVNSISPDVVMLQEHWLTPANLAKFNEDFTNYYAFGSSAMELNVQSGPLIGRPFGGVMILIRNELMSTCECIHTTERFIALKVAHLLLFNIYLPCQGTKDRDLICHEVVENILYWRAAHSDCSCLIGGDLNTNLDLPCTMSNYLNATFCANNFSRADNKKYTFINESLNHCNILDYFIYDKVEVVDYDVIDPEINFSDHLPVIIKLKVDVSLADHTSAKLKPRVKSFRWDHGDLSSYYQYTGYWLQPLYDEISRLLVCHENHEVLDFQTAIFKLYHDTVKVLINGAEYFIPQTSSNFFKFWWDEEANLLKDESVETDRLWKAAGKPRFGPIFERRQTSRLHYRRRLREGKRQTLSCYTNELHEALLHKNGPAFWKCWKSKFDTRSKCVQVDGCVDENVVAHKFAKQFCQVYSCNDVQRAAVLQTEYQNLREFYHGCPLTSEFLFDAELVSDVLSNLKQGKAAGLDRLTAEHLLHCHPVLPCILHKLFNLILLTGYVPSEFGLSYTIPLLKSQNYHSKGLTTDDFRGISISPIISKVFEYCILDRFGDFFATSSNQFGFKKGLGCSHAIYAVRKQIDNLVNKGSTVNLCAVDLSKAFDKTNHCGLFIKLMKRNIPIELLVVLERSLSTCWTCVKWYSAMSDIFKINYGVRQGSVLSPYLFGIYLDDLASEFSYNEHIFIIMYADDILIFAPSVCGLQKLLSLCEQELSRLDMCINVRKSCCLRIGPRHDIICANIKTSDGFPLQWVKEVRYLGIYIISSRHFRCSLDHAKRSFYRSMNMILGRVGRIASAEVTLQLIRSKCMPILLYGLEVCPLNNADKHSLDFTVNRFLMKLFQTNNISIVNECRTYFDFKLPSELLLNRTQRFLCKYNSMTEFP